MKDADGAMSRKRQGAIRDSSPLGLRKSCCYSAVNLVDDRDLAFVIA